jgi:hypothetical protein
MPQGRTTKQARAYGAGFTAVWGGFCPYGSTAGGSAPVIPNVLIDTQYGTQPKWCKFSAQHDAAEVGKFKVMLDSDTYDLLPILVPQVNRGQSAPTLFLPSTTAGSGILIVGAQTGPGAKATIPLIEVVTATGGSTLVATQGYVVATGVLTITSGATATNSTVVASLNAPITNATQWTGTPPTAQPFTAYAIGSSQDIFYTTSALKGTFTGGQSGDDAAYASLFLPSTTSPYGILYTANVAGAAGNSISVVYTAGGAGTSVTLTCIGNVINITVDTSATNQSILTAVNITNAATAGALVTASLVVAAAGTIPSHTAYAAAMVDVFNASTTYNLGGQFLTGGGFVTAEITERVYPNALGASGVISYDNVSLQAQQQMPLSQPYSHLAIRVYQGDTPVDMNAQTQLFVPSATEGYGVMFTSVATTATTATTGAIAFTGSTLTITMKALQPGDAGNNIAITFLNPQATLFVPSATSPDGILFQAAAAYAGSAGQQITVQMSAPNSSITAVNNCLVSVTGTNILLQPNTSATNTNVVTAVAASTAASNLVGTPVATGGSDLVVGNNSLAQALGGGYVASASTVAVAVVTGTPTTGYQINCQFGASCTGTTMLVELNKRAGSTAAANGNIQIATFSDTNAGSVVAAHASVFCTGGLDTTDLQVLYGPCLQTNISVSALNSAGTLTVGSTQYFPTSGTLDIPDSLGNVSVIAYTGKTATTFTTCTSSSTLATLAVGAVVNADAPVAVQSGGGYVTAATAQTYSATITVLSTTGFASSGTFYVMDTQGIVSQVTYAGVTATTFTTCSGYVTGNLLAAGAVVSSLPGELTTVYLGYTGTTNTNLAIATAVNAAQFGANGMVQAVPVNSNTDLNSIAANGILAWANAGLSGPGQFGAQSLESNNIIRFPLYAVDNVSGGAGA